VGTNGILECKFLLENAHRAAPGGGGIIGWDLAVVAVAASAAVDGAATNDGAVASAVAASADLTDMLAVFIGFSGVFVGGAVLTCLPPPPDAASVDFSSVAAVRTLASALAN
jgi:hypothetical protein